MPRSHVQKALDALAFPLRALFLFENDRLGLSSLQSERFDYCEREVRGTCLDVGCGRNNRFISRNLGGRGKGIDVFAYEGLTSDQILEDPTSFPFFDATFDTVTFIANLNHIIPEKRDAELAEAFRCLRRGGNIILTMGHPIAEVLSHFAVRLHDACWGTKYDVDSIRGMEKEEKYYIKEEEIRERLARAGFVKCEKKRFWTQWGLNAMYIAWKEKE